MIKRVKLPDFLCCCFFFFLSKENAVGYFIIMSEPIEFFFRFQALLQTIKNNFININKSRLFTAKLHLTWHVYLMLLKGGMHVFIQQSHCVAYRK